MWTRQSLRRSSLSHSRGTDCDTIRSRRFRSRPILEVLEDRRLLSEFTIWSPSTTPRTADASDGNSVEVGVRFTPSVSGTITGLKFYKGPLNTGTHVADLWSSSGQLLTTATFTNETASGWQQVNLSQPVAVTAGTTYVASYHTNVGQYAVNKNYFGSAYSSGPLQVPANGGVYSYGAAGSFPSSSYQGSNYWVDVVLAPSSLPSFHFDFGTATSPVASGYSKITEATTFSPTLGYGWQSGSVQSRDRGTPGAPYRDFDFTSKGVFAVSLPNGTYTVTLTSGDSGYMHDDEGIYLQGTWVDTITTDINQFVTKTYQVTISNGQLNLGLMDLGGSDPNCVVNALQIQSSSGLNVAASSTGTSTAGQTVSFSGSVSGGSAPYTYQWTFGDGATAGGALNTTHVYANPGSYTATLAITDSGGMSGSATMVVSVADVAPTVSLTAPATGTVGAAVSFTATGSSISPVVQAAGFAYNWNFGDGTTGTGANPSHAYSSAGTYTASVTATDEYGKTSMSATAAIVIAAVTVSPTINIDSNWLQQQGSGPYYLTQANTNYILQTDVTVPGTAFIVLNKNITLDLNGHTITYDNTQPMVVTDGGFETAGASATDIVGWDTSQASGAQRVPAMTGMWGSWMLQMSKITAPQTITSAPIAIPTANLSYVASITPRSSSGSTTVSISVIDAVTGAVLATGSSANANRGFSAVAGFVPNTVDPVKLRIVITPPSGGDTVRLDNAQLTPAYNYGVIVSPSYWSLPASLQTPMVVNNARYVANFTLKGGSVIQGMANGYSSSPLFGKSAPGVTVNGVTLQAGGMDTNLLNFNYASNVSVLNSTINGAITTLSNRMLPFGAIYLSEAGGTVDIEGNTIAGSTQSGVVITAPSGFTSAKIDNNNIRLDSHWSDSYGLYIGGGVTNFEVAGNTIIPISGRGIMIDGAGATRTTTNGAIHDNDVEVQERPNLEYGATGLEATAFRMRNYTGTQSNLSISNNKFLAFTQPGYTWAAIGARVSVQNNSGQMNNANVVLSGNTIGAIVNAIDPNLTGVYASTAWALSLSGIDAGSGLTFKGNTFQSNNIAVNIGDNDSYNMTNQGVLFVANTIQQLTSGVAMKFTSIMVGNWNNSVSNVLFVDTQYAGGATAGATFTGTYAKDVEFGVMLNVTVDDASGKPVAGASVTVQNASGTQLYSGTTNAQGVITGIPLVTTTMLVPAGGDDTSPTTTTTNTFTVNASSGSLLGTKSVTLTADGQAVVVVQ